MATKINLGSRAFNANKSAYELGGISKKQSSIRWTQLNFNLSLAAINIVATVTTSSKVSSNNSLIVIKKIFITGVFFDSSAGTNYDVSDLIGFYPLDSQVQNKDTLNGVRLLGGRDYQALDIICSIDQSLNTLSFNLSISGADVNRLTAIIPAAGDGVLVNASIQYEA